MSGEEERAIRTFWITEKITEESERVRLTCFLESS